MSQTSWIVVVVVVVVAVVLGFMFWPGGSDTPIPASGEPSAEQPADTEPAASE